MFLPKILNVFVTSVVLNELTAFINNAIAPANENIIVEMAVVAPTSLLLSIIATTNNEPARIATAFAAFIKVSDSTFLPKAFKVSPNVSTISLIDENVLAPLYNLYSIPPDKRALNMLSKLPNPFPLIANPDRLSPICFNTAPKTVPTPLKRFLIPANIGEILDKRSFTLSSPAEIPLTMFLNTSPTLVIGSAASLNPLNRSPNRVNTPLAPVLINSNIGFTVLPISLNTLSNKFVLVITKSNLVRKSPIFAAAFSKNPPREDTPFPAGRIAFINDLISFKPISNTAKKPEAAFLTLVAVSLVIVNLAANLCIALLILSRFTAVTGGNMFLNPSEIGLIIETKPSKALLRESIITALPPRASHPFNNSFLDLDDSSMKPPRTLLTSVHNFLASSKSPIRISQVCAHPEPIASFKVSINIENVFTSEAASVAAEPSCSNCLICSSDKPICFSSAS